MRRAEDASALRGDTREDAQRIGEAVGAMMSDGEGMPGDHRLRMAVAEDLLARLGIADQEVEPLLEALRADIGDCEVALDHQGVRVKRAQHGTTVTDQPLQQLGRLDEATGPPVSRTYRVRRLERAARGV